MASMSSGNSARAQQLLAMTPQLHAVVTLYPTGDGGRASPAATGWECPCCVSGAAPVDGHGGWPLLGDTPLSPGERRKVGFVFLSGEPAAETLRKAVKFYLWEGKIVGEATVVL
jgi:hypothetical protein